MHKLKEKTSSIVRLFLNEALVFVSYASSEGSGESVFVCTRKEMIKLKTQDKNQVSSPIVNNDFMHIR